MYYKNDDRKFHSNLASTPKSSGNTGTLPSFSERYKSLSGIPKPAKTETVGATIKNKSGVKETASDAFLEIAFGLLEEGIASKFATEVGSITKGIGVLPTDLATSLFIDYLVSSIDIKDKSVKEWTDYGIDKLID